MVNFVDSLGFGKRQKTKIIFLILMAISHTLFSASFDSSTRLIITFLGATGSGKGTQGQRISEEYGIPHISIGDLFRREIDEKTSIGLEIFNIDFKQPISDEICIEVIKKRLAKSDCARGFILDGFPRSLQQAQFLMNNILRPTDIHVPILISISKETVINRLANRYICPRCGLQAANSERDYDRCPRDGYHSNLDINNNRLVGRYICALCRNQAKGHGNNAGFCRQASCHGIALIRRPDDAEEQKIKRRIANFQKNKDEIIEALSFAFKIHHISIMGHETPKDIFKLIESYIFEDSLRVLFRDKGL